MSLEIIALIVGLVTVVGWSIYLLKKGETSGEDRYAAQNYEDQKKHEKKFRQRLKARRQRVRDWFDPDAK